MDEIAWKLDTQTPAHDGPAPGSVPRLYDSMGRGFLTVAVAGEDWVMMSNREYRPCPTAATR